MRATERYERAWNAFQIHLNHNPKASLIPFLKERHDMERVSAFQIFTADFS